MRLTLVAEGHRVMEAANGVEALAVLRASPFDAVISDILMPEMDGYRLCHEIRHDEMLRDLPVVIYSATYTSPAEEDIALGMGADSFLQKPATASAILAAIEDATNRPQETRAGRNSDGVDILKKYSERLVHKLQDRNLQLEVAKEELARSHHELQRSATQVRLLLDSTAEGIYGLDLEGRITFANFACISMLGYASPDDLLGRVAHELIHHSRLDGTAEPRDGCIIYRALLEGREARSEAEVLWRADGTSLMAAHWSHPMHRDGRLVGSVVTFIDVTARELAQAQMRQSDKRFKRLFDSNTIGIVIAKLSGEMLEANDVHLQMIGYTRQDFDEGRIRWDELTPPEWRERDQIGLAELRRTGVCSQWEKELLRKDGSRVPILIGVAMLEPSEESCIAYIVDLSKPRQLEDQLRQAQKMEAVGLLAGGVAHDFNNLLTVILGHGDLLLKRLGPADPLRDGITEIVQAGERASTLTRQLLAFSRRQILQPAVINLNDVVTDLEKMLRRLIREDIEMSICLDRRIGRVKADPGQIEQVVMNLVVNARDAMPEGGKLTIETHNVQLDAAYVSQHPYVAPGLYVMIAVSDTGTGIDPDIRPRVFEPFFTTKSAGKGTGLGLSTVYGIVKQSGGSIEFYSEVGHGTSFKVYLPRVDDPAQALSRRSDDAPAIGGSETILLVEDDEAVRALGRSILTGYGYRVLDAASGEEAIDLSERYPGTIDMAVTDMVMRGRSGSETAQLLRARRPAVKVLYVSGYTSEAVFRHGLLDGATAFLPKPFTPQSLARKVREVLDAKDD